MDVTQQARLIPQKQTKMQPSSWLSIISLGFLTCGFLGLVTWFNQVDVYHHHFFESGSLVFQYNLFRLLFALYLIWIIYYPGSALLAIATQQYNELRFIQRFIFGFSAGIGLWHLLMLGLGIFHLYYPPLVVALCTITLMASATQFGQCVGRLAHILLSKPPKQLLLTVPAVSSALMVLLLAWLFIIRGLYPSGGGDYFTHYFYYYLSVLKNHGLMPNDVWYHYYYSKGAGLHFLGMLLTDPEAPSLVTFSCVTVATIALANIVFQFAKQSFWPFFCVALYVAYNLVQINGGGGEFQKTHEETTAIVILAFWMICQMELHTQQMRKIACISLALLLTGAAILTQATAIFLTFFLTLQALRALFRKNWYQVGCYIFLCVVATTAVLSIFAINYYMTGLATDQALNTTWRYANIEKLNSWGVLPNVILVQWIRDNYALLSTPVISLDSVHQIVSFMRIDVLWLTLCGTLFVLALAITSKIRRTNANPDLNRVLILLASLILLLGVLSIFAGHSQSASYFRFSSFFLPLLVLFCTLAWVWINDAWLLPKIGLPILLIVVSLHSWRHWTRDTITATNDALHYFKGHYSIADGYRHQHIGFKFGGIHEGTLQASKHVAPGSRIWSSSVDTYCMAPGCQIESVISFKLSSKLDAILSESPENAKKILRNEHLNYFLFTKNALFLDILPYSALFKPDNIAKYLAIQWTNGDSYLLTWPNKTTKPIDKSFLAAYRQQFSTPEHPWFRFKLGTVELNNTMQDFEHSKHPWKPIEFSWRKAVKGINIVEATYGKNCLIRGKHLRPPYFYIIQPNNALAKVADTCNGKKHCQIDISINTLGDPAKGCEKDFRISYGCDTNQSRKTILIPGEANGKHTTITCPSPVSA